MKKLAIRIGVVVGVLVVLLVVAALVVPSMIPVDTYKNRLLAQVKESTGRDMRIDGPVHLSILPHLALEASQVSLANAPGGQSKEMLTLGKLQVELELFPLLRGTVVVDRFVLVDPVIALEVDKQGRANWEFTPAKPAPGQPAPVPSAPKPAPSAAGGGSNLAALESIQLGDVRLQNGTISYLDQRTGKREEIDKINTSLSLPNIDSPFKANGSLQYRSVTVNLKLTVDKMRDLLEKQGSGVQASVASDMVNFDFKGKAAATQTTSASGDIDLKVPSLRKLGAWVGAPIQPTGEGLGPLALSGKLAMSGSDVKFSDAQLSLDQIKGKGDIDVNTAGAKPDIKGKLALDSLNMNPYLPPQSRNAPAAGTASGGGAGSAGGGKAESGWSDAPIDVSGLKAANVDFTLSANNIQYAKFKIDRSTLGLRLKDARFTADLTDFAAYQGTGKATVNLDGSGAEPQIAVVCNMANVDIEPVLRDAINLDRLTGKGDLDVAVNGHGKSERAIIGSLAGKGGFKVADGEIKGLDLLKLLNSATSIVGSGISALTGGGGGNTTQFTHLSGTYTMASGIMHNSDLVLEGPGLSAAGAGTVDLPQQSVDYKVTPKVAGLGVPVLIKGPWNNLTYLPDVAGIVKGGVGGAADLLKNVVPGAGQSSGSSGSGSSSSGGLPNPLKNLFGK
ncbi:MAG TPA: AsmA family protein [Stellaceae bacterium]|nr:AsmA family protein [Stellaceae bacterium]